MKRLVFFTALLLAFLPKADACVGRTLTIGAINSSEGQLMAEILSTMISERTGTTVNVRFYRGMQELYEGVRAKQVDILVENTTRAMRFLNKPIDTDMKRAYDIVKSQYEKEQGLIWLKHFGFLNGSGKDKCYTAPVLRVEVVSNFPALPRVIEKLTDSIGDEMYARLIKSVESGEKPKKVAREFLRSKKLI